MKRILTIIAMATICGGCVPDGVTKYIEPIKNAIGYFLPGGEDPGQPPADPVAPGTAEYVYDVTLQVTNATGSLGGTFNGARGEGVLIVAGTTNAFASPTGEWFTVSGELRSVVSPDGTDLSPLLEGRTDFGPTKQLLESRSVHASRDTDRATVTGTGEISADWQQISAVKVVCDGKGKIALLVDHAELTGGGTLREIRTGGDVEPPVPVGEPKLIKKHSLPKFVSMVKAPDGSVLYSLANVYHGGHRSEVWLYHGGDVERILKWDVETATLFRHGDLIFATPEHGKHVKLWQGGDTWVDVGRTAGGWSVLGTSHEGRPLAFFNRGPYSGSFADSPAVYDAYSGDHVKTFSGCRAMPRDAVHVGGELYVSANFGDNVLIRYSDGRCWPSPMLSLGTMGGTLYGAGSVLWGPAPSRIWDGRIYRWDFSRNTAVSIVDMESATYPNIEPAADGLLIFGEDPDQVVRLTPAEEASVIARRGTETNDTRDRSYGGCGKELEDGSILWGRSESDGDYSELLLLPAA